MRTIKLDPAAANRRLPFGTSEWAADSCLAQWSQFERDWLGPEPRQRHRRQPACEPLSPLAAACAGIAVGAFGVVCWSLLRTLPLG